MVVEEKLSPKPETCPIGWRTGLLEAVAREAFGAFVCMFLDVFGRQAGQYEFMAEIANDMFWHSILGAAESRQTDFDFGHFFPVHRSNAPRRSAGFLCG